MESLQPCGGSNPSLFNCLRFSRGDVPKIQVPELSLSRFSAHSPQTLCDGTRAAHEGEGNRSDSLCVRSCSSRLQKHGNSSRIPPGTPLGLRERHQPRAIPPPGPAVPLSCRAFVPQLHPSLGSPNPAPNLILEPKFQQTKQRHRGHHSQDSTAESITSNEKLKPIQRPDFAKLK